MSRGFEWPGRNNSIPACFLAIAIPGRAVDLSVAEAANKGRPADEVILDALLQGQLQTRPFAIKSP